MSRKCSQLTDEPATCTYENPCPWYMTSLMHREYWHTVSHLLAKQFLEIHYHQTLPAQSFSFPKFFSQTHMYCGPKTHSCLFCTLPFIYLPWAFFLIVFPPQLVMAWQLFLRELQLTQPVSHDKNTFLRFHFVVFCEKFISHKHPRSPP